MHGGAACVARAAAPGHADALVLCWVCGCCGGGGGGEAGGWEKQWAAGVGGGGEGGPGCFEAVGEEAGQVGVDVAGAADAGGEVVVCFCAVVGGGGVRF